MGCQCVLSHQFHLKVVCPGSSRSYYNMMEVIIISCRARIYAVFWHLAYCFHVVMKASVEALAGTLQKRIINRYIILMSKYVSVII